MMASSDAVPAKSTRDYKKILPWLGLLAILLAYALCVARSKPTNFFGLSEDDSIYFASAHALAEGQGYVLPNLPGTPAATKYPILYPWLLSWVWRASPSFPANLEPAVGLNVIFGFAFLTAAFLFLRQLDGLSDVEALLLVAFCALHPVVLFFTANLMAEVPFAALALSSIVLAGKTVRGEQETVSAVSSGILSGLSVLMRVLGAPLALGLWLAILLRKGWRTSALFAAGALPFFVGALWRALLVAPSGAPVSGSSCSHVWQMAWLYYTNYLGFWKADALQSGAFWQMLKQNVITLMLQPGSYFIDPTFIGVAAVASVPAVVLSAAAIRGLLARISSGKWQPARYGLAFYFLPLVLWDYPSVQRFLILFLPLLVACVWLEVKRLLGRIRASLQATEPKEEKVAAVFLGAAVLALALGTGWSLWHGVTLVGRQSQLRAESLKEKREAYWWVRENTPVGSRVVAYEDAALYLYSGRQAVRPVILSPAGAFRPARLDSELSCMTEVARDLGATYWAVSDDDFGFEWEPATSRGRETERQFEDVLPQVFRSSQGRVRVYRLGCEGPGNEPGCHPGYPTLRPRIATPNP
jgi:hypothetical protein